MRARSWRNRIPKVEVYERRADRIQFVKPKKSEKNKAKHAKEEKWNKTNICRISSKNTSLILRAPWSLPRYSKGENQQRIVSLCDLVWWKGNFLERFVFLFGTERSSNAESREIKTLCIILTIFKRDGGRGISK